MDRVLEGRELGSLLDAAEAASPVEAVEAVTRELGLALGATKVSFLVADLSGRALVRLAHVRLRDPEGALLSTPLGDDERRAVEESATVLPFDGGPAEEAVRTQEVQVVSLAPGSPESGPGSWLVLAPVTERGEVIGLLELTAAIIYAVRSGRRPVPAATVGPTFDIGDSHRAADRYTPTDDGVRIDQLKNLAALRDSGALTDQEFEAEKHRILNS